MLMLANGCALALDEPMEREVLESSEPDLLEFDDEERITESQESMSIARGICIGAMSLGAALGCRAALLACASATAITVGGTAYPCAIVVTVACAAAPASAALYTAAFCSD